MSGTWRILAGLVVGAALGAVWRGSGKPGLGSALSAAELIGGLWLNALRMTIVPLVVALLVTGLARTANHARGERLAFRPVLVFVGLLWLSTAIAALLVPALLAVWPMPSEAAAALRSALAQSYSAVTAPPGVAAFTRSIVPANPIAAAAGDALLPLIVVTTLFAIAVTRLPAARRLPITDFFGSVGDSMLPVIGRSDG